MKMHASEHATRVAMLALTSVALLACGEGGIKAQVGQGKAPSLAIQNATASLPEVEGVSSEKAGDASQRQTDDDPVMAHAVLTGSRDDLRAVATASRHYAIYIGYLAETEARSDAPDKLTDQDKDKASDKRIDMQQATFVTGNLNALSGVFACQRSPQGM